MKKNEVPTKLWSRRVTAEQAQQLQAVLEGMKGSGHPSKVQVKAGRLPGALQDMPAQAVAERIAGAMAKNSMATPLVDTGVAAKMKHLEEQLALQAARADGLQVQLEEEQQCNNRQALEIDQLNRMSGSERASRYISVLQAQVAALGGKKSEYDQEKG
jgi:hypothetical protein